jgi:hypothetical protein
MKLSQKVVTVLVGLGVFFLGYLVLLILCNYIMSTAK